MCNDAKPGSMKFNFLLYCSPQCSESLSLPLQVELMEGSNEPTTLQPNYQGFELCVLYIENMNSDYSGTCLLRSPLGQQYLALLKRWPE